jgi:hypothetical protein
MDIRREWDSTLRASSNLVSRQREKKTPSYRMSLTPVELLVHERNFERNKTLRSEIHELTNSIKWVGVVVMLYIRITDIQYFYSRRHNNFS